jgi:hypothetical protein
VALPDLNTISLFEGLDAATLESLRKHLKRVTVAKVPRSWLRALFRRTCSSWFPVA